MPAETDLATEIEQLLSGVLEIQQELSEIYRASAKRSAWRSLLKLTV